jgi:hypothetical protein
VAVAGPAAVTIFLDLDNEFGFAQIFFQALVPAAQFLVFAG